ncbi:sensor histidine kinase [Thermocatellispora tengchongensis]|uniref:sensor histidine kinase n=1 Tax=Thermocatellispora tengchongensis TaxID=1073253 RepID=UPI00362AD550
MGGRRRTIRVKIAALLLVPLVSLVAIWGFAATLTVTKGLELLSINTVFEGVVVPARVLNTALQNERMESSAYLGDPVSRAALDERRQATNKALAALEEAALDEDVQADTPAPMRQRLGELLVHADRLADIRSRVDTGNFTRLQTIDAYSGIIAAAYRLFEKVRLVGDIDLIDQARAIVVMGQSRELLSQQSALLSGAVAAGKMTGEELAAFRRMVENRRLLYSMAFNQLDDQLRAPYLKLQNTALFNRFEEIEDTVAKTARPEGPLPGDTAAWGPTAKSLSDAFDKLGGESSAANADRATPIANGIILEIAVAGGLGLVAVALSIFVSIRFAGHIGAELRSLQTAALDLAHRRLPHVVERLRRGEDVDVESEVPDLRAGTTEEIADVGAAFGSVQRTAIEAAVGQAQIRKGVNQVFLNLARRNQSLLHRQLAMLEEMERAATDPETLDGLFGLDHLTTRMRRHAEGLIILSGATPGRGWRNPVSIFDVVRAAVEEVEDYLRVSIDFHSGPSLVGAAVTDVIHLVAELVENATIFSPPNTQVHVRGETVARGYALEIEDRGLGLGQEELDAINARLAQPPEFDLADSDRLGLFVVGRLAARHGIQVSLRPSPYGGTTAIVLLPGTLVVEAPELPHPMFTPQSHPSFSVERIPAAEGNGGLPRRVRQANLAPQLREPQQPQAPQAPCPRPPRHRTKWRPAPC